MAELGVAVTVVRVPLTVLLPQQLLGNALMFERLVHAGEVGFSKAPLPGGWLCREQHATQIAFIQVGRNGPVEPGLPRSIQPIFRS